MKIYRKPFIAHTQTQPFLKLQGSASSSSIINANFECEVSGCNSQGDSPDFHITWETEPGINGGEFTVVVRINGELFTITGANPNCDVIEEPLGFYDMHCDEFSGASCTCPTTEFILESITGPNVDTLITDDRCVYDTVNCF